MYIYPCILCCDIHNRSIKDNKILEYPSNEILYVIDGNYIKSFSNRILLNITSIEPLMTKVTRFLDTV